MSGSNHKYEITDIAHEEYPFLHRIRALRDVGHTVKAGDLGGFVEHEGNLSFEPGDDAWVYDSAIIAGDGRIDMGSVLWDRSIVCGNAHVSHDSSLFGDTRAEDDAYLQGAVMLDHARASGHSMVLSLPDDPQCGPALTGRCCVYGKVTGRVNVSGDTVIISGEEVCNDSVDGIILNSTSRIVKRRSSRDVLYPRQPKAAEEKKPKRREQAR